MMSSNSLTRRQLLTVLPASAGCLGCLGARVCAAQNAAASTLKSSEKADMTWDQIFDFAHGQLIPVLTNIAAQVGRAQFVEMIEKASDAATVESVGKMPIPAENRDLAAWIAPVRNRSPLFEHALVMNVVKDTSTEFAIRVTECLWAKTFRDKRAGDLGYALVCHSDFAAVAAFSPKLKMLRTKTLMQGADFCDHRYVTV